MQVTPIPSNQLLPLLPINTHPYLTSLRRLIETEGADIGVVRTTYTVSPSQLVDLYDVKCKARFEDDVVARIQDSWPRNDVTVGPVCPLRRGVCVGFINKEFSILCVGNAKFYYADSPDEIVNSVANAGSIILSEKANGEYTMLSTSFNTTGQKWVVIGSKNVRLAIPMPNPPSNNNNDKQAFLAQYDTIIRSCPPEQTMRFSYLQEMVRLWADALYHPIVGPLLWHEASQGTVVGEQCGVHSHIHNYNRQHIRVFASLPWATLTTHNACHVDEARTSLGLTPPVAPDYPLSFVDLTIFHLPTNATALRARLHEVASGSMNVYGEGVVVCSYPDPTSPHQSHPAPASLFKFKNEEYSYDRRLRTVLTNTASELYRLGMTISRLRDETKRVQSELVKSRTQFQLLDEKRFQSRIDLVPAIIAFLNQHQATSYCSDFSDCFTSLLQACEENKEQYVKLARETFADATDEVLDEWTVFMEKHDKLLTAIAANARTPQQLAEEIAVAWYKAGGLAKMPILGIAAGPGGGKTTVLKEVGNVITRKYGIPTRMLDRDAYVHAMGPQARGDVVHKQWVSDISATAMATPRTTLALVGNTFAGAFADRLEKEISDRGNVHVFLAVLKEHTVPHSIKRLVPNTKRGTPEWDIRARAALFDLLCLQRLFHRQEPDSDGSTLNMLLGAKIVLDKFFSAQPDENMLTQRMKNGKAVIVNALDALPTTVLESDVVVLAKDLVGLKTTSMQAGTAAGDRRKKTKTTAAAASGSQVVNATAQGGAGPTVALHNKPKIARPSGLKEIPLTAWNNEETIRPSYVALKPTTAVAFKLFSLADVDMFRSDAHCTFAFAPSAQIIANLQTKCKGMETYRFPVTTMVTVTNPGMGRYAMDRLQFLVGPCKADVIDGRPLHVTLGSTNVDVFPHAMSGKVHLLLLDVLEKDMMDEKDGVTVVVDNVEKTCFVEKLHGEGMVYEGVPTVFGRAV